MDTPSAYTVTNAFGSAPPPVNTGWVARVMPSLLDAPVSEPWSNCGAGRVAATVSSVTFCCAVPLVLPALSTACTVKTLLPSASVPGT
ncbi:Uncharacterised protein [Burkholderia pseudomallei]|nr:Uncharacterised protein [Burkholderia pseudomallei]VCE84789.1 Uncharacterised protein [Burkholderia pseudomallei]